MALEGYHSALKGITLQSLCLGSFLLHGTLEGGVSRQMGLGELFRQKWNPAFPIKLTFLKLCWGAHGYKDDVIVRPS